jgi:hypothetical protein
MATTQATVDSSMERSRDMTFMQIKDVTYSGVSTGTDLDGFDGTGGSVTSGEFSTVVDSTGVITIGRAGTLKLSMQGSFHASGATDFELQVHLDTGGGYADTGFGLVRTIANNSDGSFAASFHGARVVGDKIKIVMVSSTSRDITFNAIGVSTEWIA